MAVVVSGEHREHEKGGGKKPRETRRMSGEIAGDSTSTTLLEHSQNVVTEAGERIFEISKCGCDCWYCPDCCTRKGYNLRAELIPILETFTGLMMITLTIDPELFPTPKAAYLYVRAQRGISRLMRSLDEQGHLHSRRYFYVVEFQKKTEQAHFHILLDATRIPKTAIDAAWSKLRPASAGPPAPNRPPFGMTRFSKSRFDGGAAHAGRYATKYLTKTPSHGWPAWVMGMGSEQRVPRYSTSRGFWGRPSIPSNPTGETREVSPRTYSDRVKECGTTCNMFGRTERVSHETGEAIPGRSWVARLGISEESLAALAKDVRTGKVRLTLIAGSPQGCIEALQDAAGFPVSVISGLGAAGRGHHEGEA